GLCVSPATAPSTLPLTEENPLPGAATAERLRRQRSASPSHLRQLRRHEEKPLYFAVSNGDATCTEMLLKAGANPNLDPLCCLLVAVRSGHHDIVKLLLAAKADVKLLLHGAERHGVSHGAAVLPEGRGDDEAAAQQRFCDFVSVSWLDNLVGRVVSILLEYVGQVSLCSKLTKALEAQGVASHPLDAM
ncbi:hypothetical protein KUCAC02_020550, partial [Chaenocephalus aceratus]